jgi:hypothetical protein
LPDELGIEVVGELNDQPWVILSSSRKSNNYTLSEHPGINDANFGLQQFGKFTKSFNNVLRGDAGRKTWIWVGAYLSLCSCCATGSD